MTSLRILMVAPQFPPYRGGVETHVYEVGRRLATEPGVTVEVLTTDRNLRLPEVDVVEGMRVRRVRAWPAEADLYWAPSVASEVSRSSADLVHVQGYHTFVPPLAMLAARRKRAPYVLTFHSGGHSSSLRHAVRPIQIRLLRPLLRGARRLVAVSAYEAELFARSYGIEASRIVTIPNGADLPPGSDPGPQLRTPGLILSIGRLERYKGHDRVLGAMPHILRTAPHARLEILGSGPQEAELRRSVDRAGLTDAVTIRGLPREQLPPLLRAASAVVLLSEYESHGLAVHEALALGARVVASDSSALAEVRALSQARMVPANADDRAVAEAILTQLEAAPVPPGEAPALPTWDACTAALLRLYRAVLTTPHASGARSE